MSEKTALHTFEYKTAPPTTTTVKLCGSWTDWQEQQDMKRHQTSNTTWTLTTQVPLGRQCFKFVVDGQWSISQNCETTTDDSGMVNNVVEIVEERSREKNGEKVENGVHKEMKQDGEKGKDKGGICSVM